MNRRELLRSTAAAAAGAALSKTLFAQTAPTVSAEMTIHPNRGNSIPKDFLGLSFESAQLAQPDFFSVENRDFEAFVRALGTGVLRIGGNTSEYAFWTPNPSSAQKLEPLSGAIGPDPGHKPPPRTQTTPQSIRNLRAFLDGVNWRAMYGLNLGLGTPQLAAEEAAFVSATLGDRLICFQIGNEADDFPNARLRPRGYSYTDFAREWKTFHDAVKARVPNARFAGPDTGGTTDWLTQFARQFGNDIMLLSTHYYALGPASNPAMNIARLLRPNPIWRAGVPKILEAMHESHRPYRLTETNSCYGGGKPGVSNTFASSLWALDLMFQLVAIGGSGINFHGGGYGWYSPIAGTIANGFVARPEYYALLVFSRLTGGTLIQSDLDAAEIGPLFAAYSARDAQNRLHAVVVNKDAEKDVRLNIRANAHAERASVERLIAPRLDDEQDTTLAGAPVCARGAWKPERIETVGVTSGITKCLVPAGSAAVLSWS